MGWDRGVLALERLGNAGLDVAEFRRESLGMLRSLVSVDAAFFATVDPATLLFTGALAEEPLAAATPLFLDNEFGHDDVNKFARLARATDTVGTLDHVTRGDRTTSSRYREVLRPLGLGDELRVALVSGGRCWGVLCLHRQDVPTRFRRDEKSRCFVVSRRSSARGLRKGIALFSTDVPIPRVVEGPGIIVLGRDLSVVSINAQAQRWLSHLGDTDWPTQLRPPVGDLRGRRARQWATRAKTDR